MVIQIRIPINNDIKLGSYAFSCSFELLAINEDLLQVSIFNEAMVEVNSRDPIKYLEDKMI